MNLRGGAVEVESHSSIIKPGAKTGGEFFLYNYKKKIKKGGGAAAANDEGVSPRYRINECG